MNYNLDDTTIIQDRFPEDSRFRQMPVRLNGVIGAPAEEGIYPVVLILHGSHRVCPDEMSWPCAEDDEQNNYTGLTYLVEALAQAGYVALSINVNAEHTFAFGEAPPSTRTEQLIDKHIEALILANEGESDKFGLDLNGRVDLSRMVWMGHSRGADFVNWIVRQQNLTTEASPVGYGPVQGLIMVAPSVFSTDALPTVDLPMALILPTCDSDVIGVDGQLYYESARFEPNRTQTLTSVYLKHGNHNNFNTILSPDRIIEERTECAAEKMLSAEDQQDFLTQYTIDFLHTLYGSSAEVEYFNRQLGLTPSVPPPTELYDVPVQISTLFPAANRLTLMQSQDETELTQNLLGGAVTLTGLAAQYCPEGYYVPLNDARSEPCRRVNYLQPAFPKQHLFNWDAPGAEWRTAVPEMYADITEYTAVQLRAAIDPLSDSNIVGEPQFITLQLVDSHGNREQIMALPIAYPDGQTMPNDFFGGDSFSDLVFLEVLHIPLSDFVGVDLENITEIALLFDQTSNGALFISDLEFIKSVSDQ